MLILKIKLLVNPFTVNIKERKTKYDKIFNPSTQVFKEHTQLLNNLIFM